MLQKSRSKNSDTALPLIVKGLCISLFATVILVLLCAKAIAAATIPEEKLGVLALISVGMSIAVGVAAANKEKFPYTAPVIGLSYTVVLLAMTALMFGGQYQRVGITIITVMIGSILGILLKYSGKIRRKQRRMKIPRR